MMMFNKFDAIALFGPCGLEGHIKFDDRGVWPAAERGVQPAVKSDDKEHQAACTLASEFSLWRPAQELANDPNILGKERKSAAQSPMLPFRFNARELAAFMLHGIGAQVSDHYGSWDSGPDLERLDDIPQSEGMARLAVKDAYDAYRDAIKTVGSYPLALIKDANHARNAYDEANDQANAREGVFSARPGTDDSKVRRERAVASTDALESEMESTAAAAEVASEAWRNAMVRLLLQPALGQEASAPVVVVKETVAQRRARWLDWLEAEEKNSKRGALARVHARELLINPSADRSRIGSQIKEAKQEKLKAIAGGAMFRQLVHDGKRVI